MGIGWVLKGLFIASPFSATHVSMDGSRRQCVRSRENGVVSPNEGILSEHLKDVGLERKERIKGDAEILAQTMK